MSLHALGATRAIGAMTTEQRMPNWLKGADVYGGNWDARARLPADVQFLIAKCSEGFSANAPNGIRDSHFLDWQAFAAKAKLPFSAYHFGRTGSVEAELHLALDCCGSVSRLWLDLDDEADKPTMPLGNVLPFLRAAKAVGKDVGLYVDVNVLGQLLATLGPNEQAELAAYPLWIAQYRTDRSLVPTGPSLSAAVRTAYPPGAGGGSAGWAVWQYSDGLQSGIDLDVADPGDVRSWGGGSVLKKAAIAGAVGMVVVAVGTAVAKFFGWL